MFVFNSAILLLILAVTFIYIPQDHPVVVEDADYFSRTSGKNATVKVADLMRRFNCVSVVACTFLAVFCLTIKEAILQPTFENYFGLSDHVTANVATIEGYTMIGASALISMVADRRKNFNKLLLAGGFIYMAAMFIQGPVNIITPDRSHGVYWVAAGVALGGIGQAFINVNSMAALEESVRGVWPQHKMIEVNNAMGAVISGANGAGNFSGVIMGSFIYTMYSTANCLKLPSPGFQSKLTDQCNINSMWTANFERFKHF